MDPDTCPFPSHPRLPVRRLSVAGLALALLSAALVSTLFVRTAQARARDCSNGMVFEDGDGDGTRDTGEAGLAGVRVSDGRHIVATDAQGKFRLPASKEATSYFVIKPAGYAPSRRDGVPMLWWNAAPEQAPALRYGGMRGVHACRDIGLRRQAQAAELEVLVFADPQPKSTADVDYYRRDIVAPLVGKHRARLGLSLGDIVNDNLSLYPAINRVTATLGVPWLHAAGNHDLDFDAERDEDALLSFRHHYGPDTFAWEEPEANIVVLDDVIYRPGQQPAYIGGLREQQFAFLERYLAQADRSRLLVLAVHIPLFETEGRDTFRDADRARLFALLHDFPHALLLSAHNHTQQHVLHAAATGWHGAAPLHEYNVGAACGAFWSGNKDAAGIPDSTMADGTPNGHATLRVAAGGEYALAWHSARGQGDSRIGLHAPKVLRRGAYPAFGVYANVYMGRDDTRVEVRIDRGQWQPMRRVAQPDPRLLAENVRDDAAPQLRGYDRSPEAQASAHLWRGTLPTDLAVGEHIVEVRAFDPWLGEVRAATRYRLDDAHP